MEDAKVQVNVTQNSEHPEKPVVVELRTGDAAVIDKPVPVKFSGHLHAPREFMLNKHGLGLLDNKVSHLEIDEEKGSVTFYVDSREKYSDVITGSLTEARILGTFNINKQQKFTDKELAKLFKMNQFYFESKELNMKLVASLMNFSAKVVKIIEDNKDNRGNERKVYDSQVETTIEKEFVMKAPIFNGYPDENFLVHICYESSSSGVAFWLESVDLYQKVEEVKRKILDEEIKHFKEYGCAIVSK